MNLTKDQTRTVIEALREYKCIFCSWEDEDLFNDIEKLQKRYEKSLRLKMKKCNDAH